MNGQPITAEQPLTRLALALPAWLPAALSYGGRLAGTALALAVLLDQSYGRTRVLAAALAATALLSLLPLPGRAGRWLPWLAAGMLFFGGALLAHLPAGIALIVAGALAAAGVAAGERRRGEPNGVAAFFAGLGLLLATVTLTVLLVGR